MRHEFDWLSVLLASLLFYAAMGAYPFFRGTFMPGAFLASFVVLFVYERLLRRVYRDCRKPQRVRNIHCAYEVTVMVLFSAVGIISRTPGRWPAVLGDMPFQFFAVFVATSAAAVVMLRANEFNIRGPFHDYLG